LKENGQVVRTRSGEPKADPSLRDYERVPLSEDIETYFHREVQPHLPEAWIEWDKNKVGYEINFNRYFYVYKAPRKPEVIAAEIRVMEERFVELMKGVLV
jgi:type I restriction enzyme M protein